MSFIKLVLRTRKNSWNTKWTQWYRGTRFLWYGLLATQVDSWPRLELDRRTCLAVWKQSSLYFARLRKQVFPLLISLPMVFNLQQATSDEPSPGHINVCNYSKLVVFRHSPTRAPFSSKVKIVILHFNTSWPTLWSSKYDEIILKASIAFYSQWLKSLNIWCPQFLMHVCFNSWLLCNNSFLWRKVSIRTRLSTNPSGYTCGHIYHTPCILGLNWVDRKSNTWPTRSKPKPLASPPNPSTVTLQTMTE